MIVDRWVLVGFASRMLRLTVLRKPSCDLFGHHCRQLALMMMQFFHAF